MKPAPEVMLPPWPIPNSDFSASGYCSTSFWKLAEALIEGSVLGLNPRRDGVEARRRIVSGLHNLAGWLDPFRFLSPFWLVGSAPLQNGVDGWGVLVVVVAAVAALAAGSVLVDRRDLETP
jgi:hypothetical protein